MSINSETFPGVYNYRVKNKPTIDGITYIKARGNGRTIIVAWERHISINMKDYIQSQKRTRIWEFDTTDGVSYF